MPHVDSSKGWSLYRCKWFSVCVWIFDICGKCKCRHVSTLQIFQYIFTYIYRILLGIPSKIPPFIFMYITFVWVIKTEPPFTKFQPNNPKSHIRGCGSRLFCRENVFFSNGVGLAGPKFHRSYAGETRGGSGLVMFNSKRPRTCKITSWIADFKKL